MNIKITYKWLLEYLDTNADPFEIQKYLSLCGPSVESVIKMGDDYVFDIEITSNRIDTASVYGIAQECYAILPQFKKKARLKIDPFKKYRLRYLDIRRKAPTPIIHLADKTLARRITAVALTHITIKPSPAYIQERLSLCDERPINNVVDISNYIRIAFGQPVHVFDLDRLGASGIAITKSVKNETITTLDGKKIILPGNDIIIKDVQGRLIDLAGIMGAQNSEVTDQTKNILLFVPSFNKKFVRRTSMLTGQRTPSVTYFEKGLDPERTETTLVYGTELLGTHAEATIASKVLDTYPQKAQKKNLSISFSNIQRDIGAPVGYKNIISILNRLNFKTSGTTNKIRVSPPSYRVDDISIQADIVEEIARIYGYHLIPSKVQQTALAEQPQDINNLLRMENKIKYLLKHLGLHEVYNYSMISKAQILALGLDVHAHLHIKNTISQEIEYLRTSLTSSLIQNIKDNQGKRKQLRFFEIANVYHPKKNDLPDEEKQLGLVTNTSYADIKGILEALCQECNITVSFQPTSQVPYLSHTTQAELLTPDGAIFGWIGQIAPSYQERHGLKDPLYLAGLTMKNLVSASQTVSTYQPINPYAIVKLDMTVPLIKKQPYDSVVKIIRATSKYITDIALLDTFENKITLRLSFERKDRNITEEEAKSELKKIIQALE
ncbi:phenylalanine--tRNA ligase subunit beta [Candidatus Roizmanbacteria bacterium RIFCSPLOWO2_02_FULL_37_19]|uniref:phenylalanine--tRNA ligase n=1 Tax=Candidatus Roizmanbacteria bacterium RIFCSPHIGHO2_02_FULL_37_24 TaxID=1802037 RepID=A0A1F7GVC6_9BACT|nr:MAG: phenylalanine--tRNA ligase subunit beta [Candidatus Roizmanbacteria bacterium RIFCSPHIGHO2_01_FULL_38_41]OGK22908.1 MAG: phenylalanine--tRNA ligase subunit beta [Candidatus Roizmanbacteria bacterium RIFCSPHIGHO2_02_FULL_37_24]OGK33638.1 MAG: phenylalanine--tRNA ligase subunit beta [Candidatus Roizmanbacteria bacterium RIFCSPHIGHO2_12_FULL_37_23]OGK44986.1 MAG: phenylalanine--tRNA ligase subunit beta [Candidatus Roizmanbacteria bacterium RIFCSPLOWO2_01_FULL_37_57]OGK55290.1 MAG: phenylal